MSKILDGVARLPDGSGFFIGVVGPRDPGFLNWIKYRKQGCARGWLMIWRNYRSAREISRLPGQGPPMSHYRSFRYSLMVMPKGFF